MKNFAVVILLCFISSNVFALSIVYEGVVCESDSSIPAVSAQSRFTVERDLGEGNYALSISEAFLDYENTLCLRPFSSFLTDTEILQSLITPIEAFAYFNDDVLVVSYGTIARNPESVADDQLLFDDIRFPAAFTLVFDYEPSRQAFKLRSASFLGNVITKTVDSNGLKSFSTFWTNPITLTDEIEFIIED